MNRKSLRGSLLLLLGAMIWGFAFVVQRVGMESMQPVSFNGIRNLLAGLCLFPVSLLLDRQRAGKSASLPERKRKAPADKKQQAIAGLLCGIFLFLASTLQQMGLVDTSAGKAGFITALYVVLVPVTAFLLFRKNPGRWIWVSVFLAVIGLFLLCVPVGERFSLNKGDLLVLGCAICFTGQILAVDTYASRWIRSVSPGMSFSSAGSWGSSLPFSAKPSHWRGSWAPCLRFCMPASSPAPSVTPCRSWGSGIPIQPWLPC
ncbi:MAG: DMT family transporter [Clostridia bacterium]|nr:DMT family transporter [Clostridia bacterium]